MKIGEFAAKGNVSKDTVRYYVEKGLLIPHVEGKHMEFSEREFRDLQHIKKFKKANFTIKEIHFLLSMKRTSNMVEKHVLKDYLQLLEDKKKSIRQQIADLGESLEALEENIKDIHCWVDQTEEKLGVPLKALPLLACPHCSVQLKLKNADLTSRYVYKGTLFCECGYEVEIADGIIITQNYYTGQYDVPDMGYGGYYDSVGENFVTYLQKSYDYIYSRLHKEDLANKVVLETNLEGYFFLYKHFLNLKNDCTYILIDKFEETIGLFKKRIERLGRNLDILFIADASLNYPLKPNCIDYLIDFYGENEFLLYHKKFYIESAKKFFSPQLKVYGAYMSYNDTSKSKSQVPLYYPECSPQAYSKKGVPQIYEKEDFQISLCEVGVMKETYHKYRYCCHVTGENLYMNCFEAVRMPEKKST